VVVVGGSGCQSYFMGNPSWGWPNTFDFYDYSAGNITSWLWDFGDGNTSILQNPTHSYSSTSSGFYNVCLTIEEIDTATGTLLCTDTYCDSIYFSSPTSCYALFGAQDLGNNEIFITNLSSPQTGPAWLVFAEVDIDYGDGTIDYNIGGSVNYTYSTAGSYYVCITTTNIDSSGNILCTDTYCDSVTVTSGTMPCQADFCYVRDSVIIFTNPSGTIFNDIYMFCDLSTPVGYIQSYNWNMGGQGTYLWGTSDTSSAPVFEYDTFGVYNVCLTIVTMGGQCTSTTCDSISFQPMVGQTAIHEFDVSDLNLFPNPANNLLNVSFTTSGSDNVEINIINMVGQKVLTNSATVFNGNTNIILDVSLLSGGVYSVEVVLSGSERLYQRVVISR
jgi:PKD repeat protein